MESFTKLYREKLSVRIFVLSTIFIVFLCTTLFTFFIYNQMELLKKNIIREGTLLIELLAYNCRLGVFSESEKLLDASIEAVTKRKNVFFVSIYNAKGKLILKKFVNIGKLKIPEFNDNAQAVNEQFKKIQNKMLSYYLETDKDFEFWAPVYSSYNNPEGDTEPLSVFEADKTDVIIGYAHIRMWKNEFKNERLKLIYKSLSLGVIFLLIGLLAAYLVVRTITMPIKELTDNVRNYSNSGRIAVTQSHIRDEIFELAQAFNEMGKQVHDRTAELKAMVSTLQEEIELRIKSEEAVMELNRTLDDRVNTEINKQREQEKILIYQSRLSSMGEMLSSIAHHWRQPLNNLKALSLDLQDTYDYEELNKDYFYDNIKQSNEQLIYMSKTIDDFMDFFKPDKEKEQCDIVEVVEEAVSIVSPELKRNAISCNINRKVYSIASERLPTHTDSRLYADIYKNEFKQVIIILINNASDSIKEKARYSLETPYNGIIDIDFAKADGKAIVKISDNGKGIPDDIKHRVFEPYFTTKFKSQGTGIGLYMAKVIIENNLNGKIYAENTHNGASFTIELNCIETKTVT
ncbi:sensor histidine kinase [Candidatus Magnetomonas plexicatena]|uniref:sensor histidine kinase n=1 Tax=Candidatus Magnetomonas plexicatena TaxID=2552947 RepID=UPI00110059C4|nr:hypothetical protein E2O03_004190 [Nitrospirales bacterium LBB_01]